jgi:protein involved in polysaccharide export with SLBB domain
MSKVLIKSAFALALLLCASVASAQRVGPVEDDAPTGGAKSAREKTREPKPEAKTEVKPDAKPDAKSDAKPDTKPDAKLDVKPQASADVKTEATQINAAASPDAKTSPVANVATKTETKIQPDEKRDHKSAKEHPPAPDAGRVTNAVAPSKDPSSTNSPNATIPIGEKAASTVSTGDNPAPDVTPTPIPLRGNTSGSLPPPPKYEPPTPIKVEVAPNSSATNSAPASVGANGGAASSALSPTAIYRVGVGDILDIRLVGGMSKDYTLFTVLTNGTIDYPLAGEPVNVLNLTTDEIGARLATVLKRRGLFDRAQFQIGVRDFTSHTVLVSGLVEQPGQKVLRREAVPLYVVLAEAFPRADAGRVVIVSRSSGATKTIDLADSGAMNELVEPGDVINVQPRPQEFFYIAGQVIAPGQKDFHSGITLTQAILAAGGVTREAGKKTLVVVSRQGADGRLVPAEYALQEIQDGKSPDPRIQPGDRIEVGRRR